MPTPLVLVEVRSGAVVYENAAARRYARVYAPETDGWFDEQSAPVTPEARPHALATRGVRVDRIYELRGPAPLWLSLHITVRDGVAVMTFEDITALHQNQAQLREALAARDELVSMASHELRSPIGALGLVVEQISRKTSIEEVQKLARIGLRQVRRLTVLIGNLLDVSRLRAGRFALDREPAKLAEVVREACEALADHARAQKAHVDVVIDTDGDGSWDTVRMDQVIINLVGNALKYGRGTPVRVHLRPDGDRAVALSVTDGGPGIDDAEHLRIFEPFERASSLFKAQSLGLGLYIVREIVRAHGGSITLESRPGHTCFTVTLPIHP